VYLLVTGGIRRAVEGGAVTILLEMLYGLFSDVITNFIVVCTRQTFSERGNILFFLVFNLAPDEILRKMLLVVNRQCPNVPMLRKVFHGCLALMTALGIGISAGVRRNSGI
jgi:hypothetical protein